MSDCIFCKIVEGKIPSRKIYEDDEMLAFHDIQPVAPVHFMIIPKRHVDSLAAATEEHAPVLGRMMVVAGRLARASRERWMASAPSSTPAGSAGRTCIICTSRSSAAPIPVRA